jgi:hypothetical protein
MRGRKLTVTLMTALALLLAMPVARGQRLDVRRIGAAVTYISGSSVYAGAGSKSGLAPGDTLLVRRSSQQIAIAVVSAVSSASCSAQIVSQTIPPAVGDSVLITKTIRFEDPALPLQAELPAAPVRQRDFATGPNMVTGRFALQYGMAGVMGRRPDYSVPAAVMRLDVARLFGTGLTLSFHGRTSYDLENRPAFSAPGSPMSWRVYELSLSYEDQRSWYGYSLGRVMSRYVGGLGVVDGGQAYARIGGFTLGALGGVQPNFTTSAFDPDLQEFAGFVNYSWGGNVFSRSDITLAYGQEMLKGKLDRNFLYLQTSLRFGSNLFLYQSTELDLHAMESGIRTNQVGFTNSFITLTYTPASWLTVNGGYDATRTVYLFESMKSIADSLLDRSLKEGFRGSLGFRLPMNLVLTTFGNLRLASGTSPSAHTLGSTLRMSDIARSGINLGGGYARIQGLYNTGDDVTLDLDTWISQRFSASVRLDNFRYAVTGQEDRLRTLTASASVSYTFSRMLYAMVNVDQVWDSIQDAQRVFFEIGIHF